MPTRAPLPTGLVVAVATAIAIAAGGGLTQGDWQGDLAAEIMILEGCEAGFLTQVIEREVDGGELVMAKLHGTAGRTFDARREDAFAAFDVTICEPEAVPAAG